MKVLSVMFSAILLIAVVSGKNYYIYQANKLNWHAALRACLSRNMQLATINSASEQQDLERVIHNSGLVDEWLWTSGTDLGNEGNFIWMSTGLSFTYTKWSHPQPDNAGGAENCVHVWPQGNSKVVWNDWQCIMELNYICEDKPRPRVCENKPCICDDSPAVCECLPCICKHKPCVCDSKPIWPIDVRKSDSQIE